MVASKLELIRTKIEDCSKLVKMKVKIAEDLLSDLSNRILIIDGAMGTQIQNAKLEEEDFRGERFKDHTKSLKGNNDLLCITQPRIIVDIHKVSYSDSKCVDLKKIFIHLFTIFVGLSGGRRRYCGD